MVSPKKSSPKKSSPKSSPKKSSPKKSSPKASTKRSRSSPKSSPKRSSSQRSPIFDQFEHIPLPALQEILLNVDRERLNIICKQSPQAAKVCGKRNFQILYDTRHSSLIVGKLKILGPRNGQVLELMDDANNRILVSRQTGASFTNQQKLIFTSADGIYRISLTYGVPTRSDVKLKGGSVNFTLENQDREVRGTGNPRILKPAKDFLAKRGKLDWWPAFVANDEFLIFQTAMSFYKIIKTHVVKTGVKWSNVNERAPIVENFQW